MAEMTWNRKKIEADAEEAEQRGKGGAYVTLDDGESIDARLLPTEMPAPGEEAELSVKYGHHYIRSLDAYFTCVDKDDVKRYMPDGWKCQFCVEWKELSSSSKEDDQEEAREYSVSIRHASNIKPAGEDAAKIFRFNSKTWPQVSNLAFGNKGYADVLDLKNGRDINIERKGMKRDTTYTITPCRDTYTVSEKIYDTLNDLWSDLKVLSPEKQRVILKGGAVKDEDYVSVRKFMDDAGVERPGGGRARAEESAPDRAERRERERDAAPPRGGAVVKKARASDPEDAAAGGSRLPSRAEARQFKEWAESIGAEVGMDNPVDAILDGLAEAAVDEPTKGLPGDFAKFLEERGYAVGGKKVEAPRSGGGSDVDRQVEKLREARRRGGK